VLHCLRTGIDGTLESGEIPVVFHTGTGTWSGAFGCPE
jgi:hypothetical protein